MFFSLWLLWKQAIEIILGLNFYLFNDTNIFYTTRIVLNTFEIDMWN